MTLLAFCFKRIVERIPS